MINIDKTDFLYKHLQKLGEENIEEKYIEFVSIGISSLKEFKAYLYSKYAETINKDLEEDSLKQILPYYVDLKAVKKLSNKEIDKLLVDYKTTNNNSSYDQIVNSKLKDLLYVACLYQFKYPDVYLEDIIQICSLGLMKAIEKYKIEAKLKLDDYIDYWVAEELENSLAKEKDNGKD